MKTTMAELREIVKSVVLSEAKKKKEKAKDLEKKGGTAAAAYGQYDPAFDFSAPLGAYNLYKQQGASNFGPYTSSGPKIDDNTSGMSDLPDDAVVMKIKEAIEAPSAWSALSEQSAPQSVWESAIRLVEDGLSNDPPTPSVSSAIGGDDQLVKQYADKFGLKTDNGAAVANTNSPGSKGGKFTVLSKKGSNYEFAHPSIDNGKPRSISQDELKKMMAAKVK